MDKTRKIQIMGIANITGDSYFAESRCLGKDGNADVNMALNRIGKMLEEGADIIDIGACSTRPGSLGIGAEEEWKRLENVLTAVRREYPKVEISVDTYWSEVVQRCFDTIGRFMVNDISAGEDDPKMLELVGKLDLPYVAMHKRGTPLNMQSLTDYPESAREGLSDITDAVLNYFIEFSCKAASYGIREWILDPGFGFAKTIEQNYSLLDQMESLLECGKKILVGVSRKSMIYRLFNISPEEALPETQVLHMESLRRGADILRVHDVAQARRTIELYRRLG